MNVESEISTARFFKGSECLFKLAGATASESHLQYYVSGKVSERKQQFLDDMGWGVLNTQGFRERRNVKNGYKMLLKKDETLAYEIRRILLQIDQKETPYDTRVHIVDKVLGVKQKRSLFGRFRLKRSRQGAVPV